MCDVRTSGRALGSELETLLFRPLRGFGLPLPVPQYEVRTRNGVRYIDFVYPERRLAIELDGFATHGTRAAFEDDRARQNDIEELGWRFRRFTWSQLTKDAIGVAVTVGLALDLVPKRWTTTHRGTRRAVIGGTVMKRPAPRGRISHRDPGKAPARLRLGSSP